MPLLQHHFPSRLPKKVGLLGGSFNPAHEGHVHISIEAMRALGINTIWWMVSPQNPLKSTQSMADFDVRMRQANKIAARDPRIIVTDIERHLHTTHTANTLRKLKAIYPQTQFVWLMGADNLAMIHRWEKWNSIFHQCPILVLDRAPLSHQSLHSKAAIGYKKQRVNARGVKLLLSQNPPLWGFLHIRRHPASSTALRKSFGKDAFLG